jgi:hypothetical protein
MKIAYLILAHNQPELLNEFVTALNKPKEQIFVHIDKKADIQPFENLLQDKCIFSEQRERVYWAGFSQVITYINLLKNAMSNGDFDYYSFHSGVDFPIKPVHTFEEFLEKHKGSEFISLTNCCLNEKMKKRFTGYFFFIFRSKLFLYLNYCFTKIQSYFYKRKPYKNMQMFFGSSWCTLTHDCVKHIFKVIEEEKKIGRYFKHVLASDEMFFQTIIGNSPFKNKVTNENLRHIDFEENSSNPILMTIKDKEKLLASSAFFARKFDIIQSNEILNVLKENISK